MDLAVKVGWALFVAAGVLFAFVAFGYLNTGLTFVMLFLLSGLIFGFDLFTKRTRLQRRSKVVAACIVIGIFLVFFGPDVRTGTLPNGQDISWVCNGNGTGCSGITQLQSVTEYLWCWGPEYGISLPPSSSFVVTFGCLPHFATSS
jgi:drug/metabolite transporter (DMT)-like permease